MRKIALTRYGDALLGHPCSHCGMNRCHRLTGRCRVRLTPTPRSPIVERECVSLRKKLLELKHCPSKTSRILHNAYKSISTFRMIFLGRRSVLREVAARRHPRQALLDGERLSGPHGVGRACGELAARLYHMDELLLPFYVNMCLGVGMRPSPKAGDTPS